MLVMNRTGNGSYYTPGQVKSESLNESMIVWNNTSGIVDKLIGTFKGWRGNNEHAAHFQVCE